MATAITPGTVDSPMPKLRLVAAPLGGGLGAGGDARRVVRRPVDGGRS